MTVIHGIEIDCIHYIPNDIKDAIRHNKPIEQKLHVVIMISNPCLYARRYMLAREFIERTEKERDVELYVVEIAYKSQQFYVTDEHNTNHLQVRADIPLWAKENALNMGIKTLLPKSWKAVAWIDADVEFDNIHWASDTLKVLNGTRDIVQLFGHAIDLDANQDAMNVFSGFGYQYAHQRKYKHGGKTDRIFHPGFAWACTREYYEKVGNLFEMSILGSGDHNMALAWLGHGEKSLNENVSDGYKRSILEFQEKSKDVRIGYVPGIIKHYFHGTKKNRGYATRWMVLVKHQYDPYVHMTSREDGLIIPTEECPQELLNDILTYFKQRNEDEFQ